MVCGMSVSVWLVCRIWAVGIPIEILFVVYLSLSVCVCMDMVFWLVGSRCRRRRQCVVGFFRFISILFRFCLLFLCINPSISTFKIIWNDHGTEWKVKVRDSVYYIRVYYVFTSPLVFLSRDMKTNTNTKTHTSMCTLTPGDSLFRKWEIQKDKTIQREMSGQKRGREWEWVQIRKKFDQFRYGKLKHVQEMNVSFWKSRKTKLRLLVLVHTLTHVYTYKYNG